MRQVRRHSHGVFWLAGLALLLGLAAGLSPARAAGEDPPAAGLLQFQAGGHVLGFAADRVYLAGLDHALTVQFAGTAGVTPQQLDQGRVLYPELWPGISLSYEAGGSLARSTYRLAPGADPARIWRRYSAPAEVRTDGALRFSFAGGDLLEAAPVAWQEIGGRREPVEVSFSLAGSSAQEQPLVGFRVGQYNPAYPLLIAPSYAWHTFYGSDSDYDVARAIAVDSSGIYMAGISAASWIGPLNQAPLNPFVGGYNDIVVVKLDSSGAYQWHTFYGSSGSNGDEGYAIAVDNSGGVYVTGISGMPWTGPDEQAPLNAFAGVQDMVVVKLDSDGAYQWHTFYGSGSDGANAIAVDGSGVYVAGSSGATWTGSEGQAPLNDFAGAYDIAVVKLDSDGAYQWHTFYGGSSSFDVARAIVVDGGDGVYVAGYSAAAWVGPGDAEPLNAFAGGDEDTVMVKLDSHGVYRWHTFYGGSSYDYSYGIAVNGNGVYLAGTSGTSWTGPGDTEPLNALAGAPDMVVVKLDSDGAYRWHTFYGGSSGYDMGTAIVVDGNGGLYLAGDNRTPWTGPGGQVPLNAWAGDNDMVVVKLDSDGAYQWHTFYGGSSYDYSYGIAVNGNSVYLAGYSPAAWVGPGDAEPLNPFTGAAKMTVVKTVLPAPIYGSAPPVGSSINLGRAAVGRTVTASLTISNTGSAALEVTGHSLSGPQAAEFSVTPAGLVLTAGGPAQRLVLACTPAGGGPRAATLAVAHNAPGGPAVYSLACSGGYVYLPLVTTP